MSMTTGKSEKSRQNTCIDVRRHNIHQTNFADSIASQTHQNPLRRKVCGLWSQVLRIFPLERVEKPTLEKDRAPMSQCNVIRYKSQNL